MSTAYSKPSKSKIEGVKLNTLILPTGEGRSVLDQAIKKTAGLGNDQLFSAQGLQQHLEGLAEFVPAKTESACRLGIDAFFFCIAGTMLEESKLVLNTEQTVNTDTTHGKIDYVSILIPQNDASLYLDNTKKFDEFQGGDVSVFVVEAKWGKRIGIHKQHIKQLCLQIFSTGLKLGQKFGRGALVIKTNWYFVALQHESESKYSYWESEAVKANVRDPSSTLLLTTILHHWVIESQLPFNLNQGVGYFIIKPSEKQRATRQGQLAGGSSI